MRDAIIVGCGVVGATAAAALRAAGLRDVLVLDDRRPGAGTPPSGGHLRPGWFRGMKSDQYEPAMRLLDEAWGLIRQKYACSGAGNLTTMDMYRVDTDLVLAAPFTRGVVSTVGSLHNYPSVAWFDPAGGAHDERCRLLVVATGSWARELLPDLRPVTPKRGASFRVVGVLHSPLVHQWAPYKQVVAHQQTPGEYWVGDGTAVIDRNWTSAHEARCRDRCLALVPPPEGASVVSRTGLRPYAEPATDGDPCLLRRLGPRAWVATGAGKSGTIAAGWAAWRITSQLPS